MWLTHNRICSLLCDGLEFRLIYYYFYSVLFSLSCVSGGKSISNAASAPDNFWISRALDFDRETNRFKHINAKANSARDKAHAKNYFWILRLIFSHSFVVWFWLSNSEFQYSTDHETVSPYSTRNTYSLRFTDGFQRNKTEGRVHSLGVSIRWHSMFEPKCIR